MRHHTRIAGAALALALAATSGALAQLPGGVPMPGASSPLLSKDMLLTQAKDMLADLTSMKGSGKLQPAQATQVDRLLPKATSLTGELQNPQVEASRLPWLAKELDDMQKQVGALKGMMR